jgi:hypothetical protein
MIVNVCGGINQRPQEPFRHFRGVAAALRAKLRVSLSSPAWLVYRTFEHAVAAGPAG